MRSLVLVLAIFCISGCTSYKQRLETKAVSTATTFYGPVNNIGMIDNDSFFILNSTLGQIVSLDEYGGIKPDLAERWEVSEDQTRYRFFFREGLTYSDGQPFDIQHAIHSFHRFLHSNQFYPQALKSALVSIKAVTPRILEMKFSRPVPRLLTFMASRISTAVVHPEMIAPGGTSLNLKAPTLGLYSIVERSPESLHMHVRKEHHGYRPDLPDKVTIINADKRTALGMVKAKRLDFLFLGGAFDSQVDSPPYAVVKSSGYLVSYMKLNLSAKCSPLAAAFISSRIDRKKIVLDLSTKPSRQLLPPNVVGALSEQEVDEAIPAQKGKVGFGLCPLKVCVLKNSSILKSIDAAQFTFQLNHLGFKARLVELESGEYSKALEQGREGCHLTLVSSMLEDSLTEMFLGDILTSYADFGTLETEVSDLFKKIHYALSLGDLAQHTREVSRRILKGAYLVPLGYRPVYWLIREDMSMHHDSGYFHTIRMQDE